MKLRVTSLRRPKAIERALNFTESCAVAKLPVFSVHCSVVGVVYELHVD